MGSVFSKVEPVDSFRGQLNGETYDILKISQLQTQTSTSSPHLLQNKKYALGIIDMQADFCRGGALMVNGAEEIIGPINRLRHIFKSMPTFVSLDMHPPNHVSFATTHGVNVNTKISVTNTMPDGTKKTFQQDMWPTHCVKGTLGCTLHPDVVILPDDFMVEKGTRKEVESYSAFGDEFQNTYEKTALLPWLKERGITDVILVGVATDYCVANTAYDALRLGFTVHIISSCTRGVSPATTSAAIANITHYGDNIHGCAGKLYSSVDEFLQKNAK